MIKNLDREWVEGNFNYLHIYQDLPGMYDAWDILPNYKEKELELKVIKPFSVGNCDERKSLF
jgi:alpha-mannosidase